MQFGIHGDHFEAAGKKAFGNDILTGEDFLSVFSAISLRKNPSQNSIGLGVVMFAPSFSRVRIMSYRLVASLSEPDGWKTEGRKNTCERNATESSFGQA